MSVITEDDVIEAQQKWGDAVAGADAGVLSLYAANAALKPTLSNVIRREPEELQAYFLGATESGDSGFLKKGINEVRFTESSPILLGQVAVDVGKYVFVDQNGGRIEADFTFVYFKQPSGEVVIVAHHSSLPV